MAFVADKFVSDLVLLHDGGTLRRDYVAETVRQVCAAIAAGKVQGVQTKDILRSNLLFTTPHLVYRDGSTRALRDVFPRDYFPVFLVQGESDLCSGDIAELFEASPGEFEVRGPRGERIRATTLEALTFTPANLSSGTPTDVTAVANFTATDEIPVVAYEPPANSLRASLLRSSARGCAPLTTATTPEPETRWRALPLDLD